MQSGHKEPALQLAQPGPEALPIVALSAPKEETASLEEKPSVTIEFDEEAEQNFVTVKTKPVDSDTEDFLDFADVSQSEHQSIMALLERMGDYPAIKEYLQEAKPPLTLALLKFDCFHRDSEAEVSSHQHLRQKTDTLLHLAAWQRDPELMQLIIGLASSEDFATALSYTTYRDENVLHILLNPEYEQTTTSDDLLCLVPLLRHAGKEGVGRALVMQNRNGHTPLTLGLQMKQLGPVIELINAVTDEALNKAALLQLSNSQKNCLHLAVERHLDQRTFDTLVERLAPETFEVIFFQEDMIEMTPVEHGFVTNKMRDLFARRANPNFFELMTFIYEAIPPSSAEGSINMTAVYLADRATAQQLKRLYERIDASADENRRKVKECFFMVVNPKLYNCILSKLKDDVIFSWALRDPAYFNYDNLQYALQQKKITQEELLERFQGHYKPLMWPYYQSAMALSQSALQDFEITSNSMLLTFYCLNTQDLLPEIIWLVIDYLCPQLTPQLKAELLKDKTEEAKLVSPLFTLNPHASPLLFKPTVEYREEVAIGATPEEAAGKVKKAMKKMVIYKDYFKEGGRDGSDVMTEGEKLPPSFSRRVS